MSIDVNVQNDLVIVTESSEDITVNVSNAAGPAGVGVPSGGSTGQVLKKFTNTDFDTYWAADASGLTSVGLSMPNAFAVSNSPLTSNGTIAVTGAGTASQYIRGDGVLATLPTGGSGGSSVSYYLNGGTAASVGTYFQMSTTAVVGANADFTRTGNGLISQFLTDAGDPNRLQIPAGNWNFEMFFSMSSSGGTPEFYVELLKYDGTTFTSIASSSAIPEVISGGTIIDLYLTSLAIPATILLATDRLALRVYIVNNSGGRTATLHTQDSHLCQIITNFAGGVSALNGLTANTQYFATGTSGTDFAISSATDTHTFNLPTASGTNRGALSSADWTTFSGKVGGTGATGQVAYWNGTNSQTGSNNLFWDNTNLALNVGINTLTSRQSGWSTIQNGQSLYTTRSSDGYVLFGRNFYIGATGNNIYVNNGTSSALEFDARNFSFLSAPTGTAGANPSFTKHFQLYGATGNLVLQNGGTFSDGGQRLQVYGDAFVKGSGNTGATNALLVQNSSSNNILTVQNGGNVLFSNNIFINNTIYSSSGNLNFEPGSSSSLFRFKTFANANSYLNIRNLDGAFNVTSGDIKSIVLDQGFAPTSGTATMSYLLANPTINQTGGANGITRGLYVNPTLTAAADWRSIEWSNNSGWGLYGAGTANNYLAGNLGISTTSPIAKLETFNNSIYIAGAFSMYSNTASDESIFYFRRGRGTLASPLTVTNGDTIGSIRFAVQFSSSVGGYNTNAKIDSVVDGNGANLCFHTNSGGISNNTLAERMRITAAGRLLLGTTTESTFLLDVNGTARVSGSVTISTGTTSQGTFIGAGGETRYSSNSGLNTNSVYLSGTSSTSDGIIQFLSGGATSNIVLYTSAGGFIGTRAGAKFGAIDGSDTVSIVTNTWIKIGAGTTARSQINLTSSTAPTSPNNGDIWFDGTDLKMRIGGVTKTFTLV